MESLNAAELPEGALLLVDSAPIIYVLEGHDRFAARFAPLFARHAAGEIFLAVTPITVVEVLTGPLRAGEEALARRYRGILESWQVVDFTSEMAEAAARLRGKYGLKLPHAIQAASALAINAHALVTHDRDFTGIRGLRILN